jgi:heme-degrading monooxygenase HmoA
MFTRLVTFTDASNIDAGIDYVRDTVSSVLHQQKGFAGTIASADRANGVYAVLTRWETEADRDASESALLKVREEGQQIVGGRLSVEYFEEVRLEKVAGPPRVGAGLLVTRASMDPAKVEDNLRYFEREVLPEIKKSPGLLFVRQLINRKTGDALVGSGWTDAAAMRAGAVEAENRQRNTPDLPVTIVDRSQREIVFIDQP